MLAITSLHNPLIKRMKSLLSARGRRQEGAFIAEGEVMIREALSSGLIPEAGIFQQECPLAMELEKRGAQAFCVPRSVIEAVCDTKTPQGQAAAFRLPESGRLPGEAKKLVALDGVQDPGNVGTIIRTLDAAGLDGLLLGEGCPDVFSPKVMRSTMGSAFRVKTEECALTERLVSLKSEGYKVITSALDGQDMYSVPGPAPEKFVLVIGSEAHGVSPEVQAVSDIKLKIPMRGKAESLNAAVAAGILMYHLTANTGAGSAL
ncbi:MAG: RNA methyltransferase [Clostridia bacterium]|nr:RNA methyltransferase [Clostridia bacterium]